MCVDKIRDVKETGVNNVQCNLTASFAKFLSRNPYRRAIVFNCNSSVSVFICLGPNPPPSGVLHFVVAPNVLPFVLDFATYGSAIFQEVWLAASGSTPTVYVTELTQPGPEPSEN